MARRNCIQKAKNALNDLKSCPYCGTLIESRTFEGHKHLCGMLFAEPPTAAPLEEPPTAAPLEEPPTAAPVPVSGKLRRRKAKRNRKKKTRAEPAEADVAAEAAEAAEPAEAAEGAE